MKVKHPIVGECVFLNMDRMTYFIHKRSKYLIENGCTWFESELYFLGSNDNYLLSDEKWSLINR